MSNTVIKVENLGKQYRLGQVGTGTLSTDINRWWHKVRGKEDPYLQIGETNDRTKMGGSDLVWALKDINFEVKQGEVLGIIGKNGAGKSTLLKILSQVTGPTVGDIKVKGRIASLLEVGTGFHPDLSGRENVFLNGAILGMSKQEIKNKFDEIVAFSGVERYINTPVKRYSSGMYVRLAFAVAAHLEPEILIVDEVLAVGDAEFQKKCLGKMKDVSGEGRTVLFVSHNMAAVKELCSRAILLQNGVIVSSGKTNDVFREYLASPIKITSSNLLNDSKTRRGHGEVRFTEVIINNGDLSSDPSEEIRLNFSAVVLKDVPKIDFMFSVSGATDNLPVTNCPLTPIFDKPVQAGTNFTFDLTLPKNTFRTGVFPLYLWIGRKGELAEENYHYDCIDSLFNLNFISLKNKNELGYDPMEPYGVFNVNYKIENAKFV